jgi:nucleotide-binding universal stress UspA family protein
MFEKILVCLDGSKLSEQILPLVEGQALKFRSKVILLQVVTVPTATIIQAGATYSDPKILAEQERVHLKEATTYLENVSQSLQSKGLQVEAVVIEAFQVGKAILNYAEENGINLIAIATHGHGGLGRLVFGSIAEYVLRESGLPMLVIRPNKI